MRADQWLDGVHGWLPETALAVVDALPNSGLSGGAASIVAAPADSVKESRADGNAQVAWEATAFVTAQRLKGPASCELQLITLLGHASS
jgi:hypothetical protein